MKSTVTGIILLIFFLTPAAFSQPLDTDCEFECNNEYREAKFQCSENWAGPEQDSNKEYCLNDAQNSFERCKETCMSR